MKKPDRSDYESEKGTASWWSKDGAWHIALPYVPTDEDRRLYSVSYPEGDDGPFYQWTEQAFDTKAEAINAIQEAS